MLVAASFMSLFWSLSRREVILCSRMCMRWAPKGEVAHVCLEVGERKASAAKETISKGTRHSQLTESRNQSEHRWGLD